MWCADDIGVAGAEFLGGRIVVIRDPGLRLLGDSRWVKDSKAFLPGPLVLAGLILRFSDLFVASACPAAASVGGSCCPRSNLGCRSLTVGDFSETHHRRLSAP